MLWAFREGRLFLFYCPRSPSAHIALQEGGRKQEEMKVGKEERLASGSLPQLDISLLLLLQDGE